MRYSISVLLALLFVIATAHSVCGQALEVTSAPGSITAKRGQPVVMAAHFRNVLMPREPVTVTAQAEWEDEYGVTRTATASTTINVIQPIKVNTYKVVVPALFDFVAGSAKVNGQPIAPALDSGELTFDMDRTLLEGESVTLEYTLKAR